MSDNAEQGLTAADPADAAATVGSGLAPDEAVEGEAAADEARSAPREDDVTGRDASS